MTDYSPYLEWLDVQHSHMCELVTAWANVNSWSRNLDGLDRMLSLLEQEFLVLGGEVEKLDLPPQKVPNSAGSMVIQPIGRALRIRKRPTAPLGLFLCCHMDTVYPPDNPFQQVIQIDDKTFNGPGVTDAKGGLAVMLKAVETLERSPWAKSVGWEVLINPDEEIGSPGSTPLLEDAATRNHVGLVFEPSLPDGNLVESRKGSGNFTVIAHGKAAHAGREPHLGRNAINTLAWFIVVLNAFVASQRGMTVNVGYFQGGGPVNVVPDQAVCRFNVRASTLQDQLLLEQYLTRVTDGIKLVDGISVECYGGFARPPKPLDANTLELLQRFRTCGRDLGISIHWGPSGGACDGNNLAAAGLPTVDSLGVRGGEIHSDREYVMVDSLVERAKLTALFLMKLASGEIKAPSRDVVDTHVT